MKHVTYSDENQKRIEVFLLLVYTVYSFGIFSLAIRNQWSIWSDLAVLCSFMLAWIVQLTGTGTYTFRAYFSAVMMQISVIIYGVHVENILVVLPIFYVFVVLFGTYGKPKIFWTTVITALFMFFWHAEILKSIPCDDSTLMIEYISQLITTLLLQYVVYMWTRQNSEGSRQLMDIVKELAIVESSKDDFVANVSHEIRTPINTICGMSEVLLKEELPPEIKENVRCIQMAGRNLTGVVRDILDYSELQSGKIEIEEEAYNITSTVNDVINTALALKDDKDIELIVDCNANIPSVLLGDEKKLRRIIMNLISNGIKFTEKGCVSIKITFRKEDYGINLILSVKDTGIGISESDLEKLFKGFNQVDSSRKRQEGGLGLGLAITNVLVKKMGGALTIKSKPDKGTLVQVVVPQKVLDETPIATITDRHNVNVATYIDMEQFDILAIREEYTSCIINMVEELKGKCKMCRNLAELQRRESKERFSHIFISYVEYMEDPIYFDELSKKTKVIIILNRNEEQEITNPNLLKIYKPFYILTIVSVLNGLLDNSNSYEDGISKRDRFITRNTHVLVVDDNQMNLRVAEELLAKYAIKVTTATGGRDALKKVMLAEYDFIFMDHMMPEMDGVETLRHIRHKIGTYYQKVPIIVLTANAVAGTREMLMAEGFNDFLEKPIESSVLERVLKRNLQPQKIIYLDDMSSREDMSNATTEINLKGSVKENVKDAWESLIIEGIDTQKGLLYCGGREQYIKILKGCCEDWDVTGKRVTEAYIKQDWKNYTVAVHGLKGAMRTIGATKVSEMAQKLEFAGKENNIEYILKNHDKLMREYKELYNRLRCNSIISPAKIHEESESDLPEIEQDVFENKIAEMENAMYALDGNRMLAIIEELQQYKYRESVLGEVLKPIRRKVEMSDYISAVESLVKWKDGLADKEI